MKLVRIFATKRTVSAVGCALIVVACAAEGSRSENTQPTVPGTDDASTGNEGGTQTDSGGPQQFGEAGPDADTCTINGSACGSAGVCAGGACCESIRACGDTCCSSPSVCTFQGCVTPGAACASGADCADTEFCDYTLGTKPDAGTCVGATQGRCMPKPPRCDGGTPSTDGGAITCLNQCEYRPPPGAFQLKLKQSWRQTGTAGDVMMTPIVLQLDDDDCDGKVTTRDIPEIVFTSFASGRYNSAPGTLHAISIVKGVVVDKWNVASSAHPTKQVAGGNIDGLPGNEVVYCGYDNKVYAVKGDGSALWSTSETVDCAQPAIADMNADGRPEVVVEGGILDGASGAIVRRWSMPTVGSFVVSDLDGDGFLDFVTSGHAFRGDGTLLADTGATAFDATNNHYFRSNPAVADLDKDGKPEVLAVYVDNHGISIWQYDPSPDNASHAKFVRQFVNINQGLDPNLCPTGSAGRNGGGGPVTVGDFNQDGYPDVALAGGVGYAVFDGQKLMNPNLLPDQTGLWRQQTRDCSSAATGSSLFDFDGDGKAEVLYSDEQYLRVYNGLTGAELAKTCNTTGTLNEYPVVADVDNDGQADIIVGSNSYSSSITCEGSQQTGIRIFGSLNGDWVRTRSVWNEYAYHITNVNDDGTIPTHEAANWLQPGFNNFRQNKQSDAFGAPDATIEVRVMCQPYGFVATIRNVGEAVLPAGSTAQIFAGSVTGTKLGEGKTSVALYPAQAEQVVIPVANAPTDVSKGITPIVGTVQVPTVHQCRDDNDTSAPASGYCKFN